MLTALPHVHVALALLAAPAPATPAAELAAAPVLTTEDENLGAGEQHAWEFSGSVFYSDPPGSRDRLTTVVYADRGPLHLEGRYNYEDLDTGALFAGWTWSGGDEVAYSATPMLGAVVGDTDGFAPGLEVDLGWKRLAWYTEMEYLFDVHDHDEDYFYSWSTLTYGVTDALRAGLVTEKTKLVDTDFEYQRGLAVELQLQRVGVALYAYNLGTDDSYAVVSVALGL